MQNDLVVKKFDSHCLFSQIIITLHLLLGNRYFRLVTGARAKINHMLPFAGLAWSSEASVKTRPLCTTLCSANEVTNITVAMTLLKTVIYSCNRADKIIYDCDVNCYASHHHHCTHLAKKKLTLLEVLGMDIGECRLDVALTHFITLQ